MSLSFEFEFWGVFKEWRGTDACVGVKRGKDRPRVGLAQKDTVGSDA